jgi:hypothetical protein
MMLNVKKVKQIDLGKFLVSSLGGLQLTLRKMIGSVEMPIILCKVSYNLK